MWIDGRIQGKLRELLYDFEVARQQGSPGIMDLATTALEYAQKEADPYGVAEATFAVSTAHYTLYNTKEAIKLANEVLTFCEKEGEYQLLTRAKMCLAHSYLVEERFTEAEQMYHETLHMAEQHELVVVILSVYHGLTGVYSRQGRLQEAIDFAYQFQDKVQTLDADVHGEQYQIIQSILSHDTLGYLLGEVGDHQASRSHYEQVLTIAKAAKLHDHESNAYFNLGTHYNLEQKYDLGIEYIQKALNVEAKIYYKIYQLDGLSRVYIDLDDLDNAEKANSEAMGLALQTGSIMIATLTGYKGKILLARNDPNCIPLLLEALSMKRKSGDASNVDEFLKDIIQYYKSIGDYEHAFQYHEELMGLIKKNSDGKQQALSIIELERREQDKKIFQLELEKKESKLKGQERELALTASQLASQADLLSHFRNDLRKIVRDMADPIDALRHIKQKLKDLPCEQIDWAKFEADFVVVHPEFRQKLLGQFPDLTPQETKMCMLARLGLKNAEIARLTCLSERSVENHRFNLRKKLGLKTEQKLSDFLATIR